MAETGSRFTSRDISTNGDYGKIEAGQIVADKLIRCDECGFTIGSLTQTAHGSPVLAETGSDMNCKHPPISQLRTSGCHRVTGAG
jgi:hypothetical protein